jgi:hypothetical protein
VSHFTVFTLLADTRPAEFVLADLTISPPEVGIGEQANISVLLTNNGDLTGTHQISVKINNKVVSTQDVTLAGGTSQVVDFALAKLVAGSYTVEVDGISGILTVEPPPVPAAVYISGWTIYPGELDVSGATIFDGQTEPPQTQAETRVSIPPFPEIPEPDWWFVERDWWLISFVLFMAFIIPALMILATRPARYERSLSC